MRRMICFLALSFLLSGFFSPVRGTGIGDASGPGFIWVVEIHNSTIFLCGSVHSGKKEYYPLPEAYLQCYDKADALIMEIAEDFDSLENLMLDYAEKDRLEEDLYFRNNLDSASIEMILRVIDRDKFLKYDQYKGWFLNMILVGNRLKLAGFDPEYGIDKFFREKAAGDRKEVKGLERFQDQVVLFEFDLPYETQVKILERTLGSMEMQAGPEAHLMEAYFSWDPQKFRDVFLSMYDFSNPSVKNAYEQIFTNRNRKWVEMLDQITSGSSRTYMMVVGAGHFFGPDNIIDLFTSKGYEVKPLDQETSR